MKNDITVKPLICMNCSRTMNEHYAVNFSDGNLISNSILICPTAIFSHQYSFPNEEDNIRYKRWMDKIKDE